MTTTTVPRRKSKSVRARGAQAHPRRASAKAATTVSHVTPTDGNVFADLGFSPAEAENLKVRAQLMRELRSLIAGVTQVEAARLLGISQPRVSDLKRGKIGLFTIDALVNMLGHAGVRLRVSLFRAKRSAA
jgi:predicted XRE-type DNA-binding protein